MLASLASVSSIVQRIERLRSYDCFYSPLLGYVKRFWLQCQLPAVTRCISYFGIWEQALRVTETSNRLRDVSPHPAMMHWVVQLRSIESLRGKEGTERTHQGHFVGLFDKERHPSFSVILRSPENNFLKTSNGRQIENIEEIYLRTDIIFSGGNLSQTCNLDILKTLKGGRATTETPIAVEASNFDPEQPFRSKDTIAVSRERTQQHGR